MRKVISTTILAIIIIVGILPYWMGYLAKSSYEELLNSWPSNMPVKMEIKDYKLGWWSSTADVLVEITDPALQQQVQKSLTTAGVQANSQAPLMVVAHIQHGPIIIAKDATDANEWQLGRGFVTSQLVFDPGIADKLQKLFGSVPLIKGTTLITLPGNFHSSVKIAGINYTDPARQGTIKWSGLTAQARFDKDFTRFRSNGQLGTIDVQMPDIQINLASLNVESNARLNKQYNFWVGKGNLDLSSFKLTGEGKQVTLKGLSLASSQELSGNLANANVNVKMDALAVNDQNYGPANFEFSVRNIDAVSWGQLQKQVQNINRAENLSPTERDAQMMLLMPQLISLINQGAEFDLKTLEVKTPDGQISAQAKITLTKVAQPGNTIVQMQSLLRTAKASINIKIPSALVKKIMLIQTVTPITSPQKTAAASNNAANAAPALPAVPGAGTTTPTATATGAASANPVAVPAVPPQQQAAVAEQQVQQKIDTLKNSGMLVEQGNSYQFTASYDQGKMTVNGKVMPFNLPL